MNRSSAPQATAGILRRHAIFTAAHEDVTEARARHAAAKRAYEQNPTPETAVELRSTYDALTAFQMECERASRVVREDAQAFAA